ncbi:YidB family protein [Crenobacter caeni]|uniref:DUF937 domain-containing protein n=1 Tax=Crenobacter caeni TaxID=2705474 RepID=A0A6B2KTI2_9NEIS|nr:YidB family protein [Crenobacter caeni]NDV13277.1 DUF937 domain-containing protein [Crenobacter caeni]
MGLLDQLAGAAGAGGGEGQGMAGVLGSLLEQNGGLSGLIDKFGQQGLGDAAASWMSTGENQPISAEQIESVLGGTQLGELAGRFGLDSATIAQGLSTALPLMVDKLTPDGQVPQGGDLLSQGVGLLKGLFGR